MARAGDSATSLSRLTLHWMEMAERSAQQRKVVAEGSSREPLVVQPTGDTGHANHSQDETENVPQPVDPSVLSLFSCLWPVRSESLQSVSQSLRNRTVWERLYGTAASHPIIRRRT